MTNQTFPITPPPELVQKLRKEAPWGIRDAGVTRELCLIADAYRAGADQELEACCEWLDRRLFGRDEIAELRAARRPKPPSLRKQAYDALDTYIYGEPDPKDKERTYNTIRRALEQLND